jgi:hypothetical protein
MVNYIALIKIFKFKEYPKNVVMLHSHLLKLSHRVERKNTADTYGAQVLPQIKVPLSWQQKCVLTFMSILASKM